MVRDIHIDLSMATDETKQRGREMKRFIMHHWQYTLLLDSNDLWVWVFSPGIEDFNEVFTYISGWIAGAGDNLPMDTVIHTE